MLDRSRGRGLLETSLRIDTPNSAGSSANALATRESDTEHDAQVRFVPRFRQPSLGGVLKEGGERGHVGYVAA